MSDNIFAKMKEAFSGKKKGKALFIIGLSGILLIYLSTFLEGGKQTQKASTEPASMTSTQYCAELEEKVKRLVEGITGNDNVQVAVTLDTGVQYLYTDENKKSGTDSNETASGVLKSESTESTEQTYVTVKSADGGEEALLRTEYMPTVRGVAVVCDGLTNEAANEITNAIMAALDITSKRVYVVGHAPNQKGGS